MLSRFFFAEEPVVSMGKGGIGLSGWVLAVVTEPARDLVFWLGLLLTVLVIISTSIDIVFKLWRGKRKT